MMASRFKLRLKRNKRRARAQSRTATAAQHPVPIAAQQTQSGVEVLRNLAQRFDEAFESKSPRKVLVNALASKN